MKAVAVVLVAFALWSHAEDRLTKKDGTVLTGELLSNTATEATMRITRGTLSVTVSIDHAQVEKVEHIEPSTQPSTQPTTAPAVKLLTPQSMSVSVERFKEMRAQAAAAEQKYQEAKAEYVRRVNPSLDALHKKYDGAEADMKSAQKTRAALAGQYSAELARAQDTYNTAIDAAKRLDGTYDIRGKERAADTNSTARAEIDGRYQPQIVTLDNRINNDKAAMESARKEADGIMAAGPRR